MFPKAAQRDLVKQSARLCMMSTKTARTGTTRSQPEIARLIQERVKERNAWAGPKQPSNIDFWKMVWNNSDFFFPKLPSQEELDRVFPVQPLDWDRLLDPPESNIQVTWLGHASLLVQMDGCNFLTDPVFAERVSPFSFAGPKRYRPTPCALAELVEKISLDFVLLSHNHYDHLCLDTVKTLASSASKEMAFVVPLGLKAWMERYVTASHTIYELDWHESTPHQLGACKITAVPMKHWSNRTGDRDKTLWCGFVVEAESKKFLFPGDTAWFDGLYDLGTQYGPFDMAAIPIGAYEPRDFMQSSHINVEEAVKMKSAVQAKKAVSIHWGTFPLTTEPVMEPQERLLQLMDEDDSFGPWLIGETIVE